MTTLVVDASIGIKWFKTVGEKQTKQAIDLLNQFRDQKVNLCFPDIFLYEMTNIAKYDKKCPESVWEGAIKSLFALSFGIYPIDQSLAVESYNLAKKLDLTVYDAAYLVLAKKLSTRVVTQDQKLLRLAPDLTKAL